MTSEREKREREALQWSRCSECGAKIPYPLDMCASCDAKWKRGEIR